MSLFHFGKKKEASQPCSCSCAQSQEAAETVCACSGGCCGSANGITSIKVLGSGCKSCHELYENAKSAAANLGLSVEVEYVTDMEKVMTYGAMRMPALVINETVAAMGKVLKASEVEALLRQPMK